MIVNPNVTTYKIRFIQYGEDLDKGEFSGVCYIEERAGKFTLLGVHNGNERVNELKIDIIRPGGYVRFNFSWQTTACSLIIIVLITTAERMTSEL